MTNFIKAEGFTYDCGYPYAYVFTVNKDYIYKWYGKNWMASLRDVLSDVHSDIERLLACYDGAAYGLALKSMYQELCRGCLPTCIHVTVHDVEDYMYDHFEYVPILDEVASEDPDTLLFRVDTDYFYRTYGEDWNNGRFFSDFKHEQDGLLEFPTRAALKYILAYWQLVDCKNKDIPDYVTVPRQAYDELCAEYAEDLARWDC